MKMRHTFNINSGNDLTVDVFLLKNCRYFAQSRRNKVEAAGGTPAATGEAACIGSSLNESQTLWARVRDGKVPTANFHKSTSNLSFCRQLLVIIFTHSSYTCVQLSSGPLYSSRRIWVPGTMTRRSTTRLVLGRPPPTPSPSTTSPRAATSSSTRTDPRPPATSNT